MEAPAFQQQPFVRSAVIAAAIGAATIICAPQMAHASGLFDFFKSGTLSAEPKSAANEKTTKDAKAKKPEKPLSQMSFKEFAELNPPPPDAVKLAPDSVTRVMVDATKLKIFILGFKDRGESEVILDTIDNFKVGPGDSLGHKFGKEKLNDHMTPLGTYSLVKKDTGEWGPAFMIGYPTAVQINAALAKAKTEGTKVKDEDVIKSLGKNVEVHSGYPPGYDPIGYFDWTDGCIAIPNWRVVQLHYALRAGATITIEMRITPEMLLPKKFPPSPEVMAQAQKPAHTHIAVVEKPSESLMPSIAGAVAAMPEPEPVSNPAPTLMKVTPPLKIAQMEQPAPPVTDNKHVWLTMPYDTPILEGSFFVLPKADRAMVFETLSFTNYDPGRSPLPKKSGYGWFVSLN